MVIIHYFFLSFYLLNDFYRSILQIYIQLYMSKCFFFSGTWNSSVYAIVYIIYTFYYAWATTCDQSVEPTPGPASSSLVQSDEPRPLLHHWHAVCLTTCKTSRKITLDFHSERCNPGRLLFGKEGRVLQWELMTRYTTRTHVVFLCDLSSSIWFLIGCGLPIPDSNREKFVL